MYCFLTVILKLKEVCVIHPTVNHVCALSSRNYFVLWGRFRSLTWSLKCFTQIPDTTELHSRYFLVCGSRNSRFTVRRIQLFFLVSKVKMWFSSQNRKICVQAQILSAEVIFDIGFLCGIKICISYLYRPCTKFDYCIFSDNKNHCMLTNM